MGRNIKDCEITNVTKNKIDIILTTDVYIPKNIVKGSLILDKRLLGYAILRNKELKEPKSISKNNNKDEFKEDTYIKTLENFYNNKTKNNIILPKISLKYLNTYSYIMNFDKLSNALNVKNVVLGEFIQTELGLKSFSIKENMLYLKGRTTINKVQKIIVNYIKEYKSCKRCNSINTCNIKIMNASKIKCNECGYTN
jgi:translation initiation factor 2 beta subunit (eIF-2beta)/eIF-5